MSLQEESIFYSDNPNTAEQSNVLRRGIAAYIRKWPWFIISIALSLFAVWFYLRYVTPVYKSVAKVLIRDAQANTGGAILLSDIAATNSINGGITNEIEILKSKRLMYEVVQDLNLETTYFREGRLMDVEAYGDRLPILLKFLPKQNSTGSFSLSATGKINGKNIELTFIDEVINTQIGSIFKYNNKNWTIIKNPNFSGNIDNVNTQLIINIRDKTSTANRYQSALDIRQDKGSSVLDLSLAHPVPQKSRDILNRLVVVYNKDAIADKNLEFQKTAEFIEERLNLIQNELGDVETQKEKFKISNNIADLTVETGIDLGNDDVLSAEKLNLETQLELVDSYSSYINKQSDAEILPSNVSINSAGSNQAISAYNALIRERNELIARGATEQNPLVADMEQSIASAKKAIAVSLKNEKEALRSSINDLSVQLGKAKQGLSRTPTLEKRTRNIERQQMIKENLYLLLLQKREEAAISLAITSPKAKVIDNAFTLGSPVSPQTSNYYLGAFAIGFLLPLGFIYAQQLLKNKIETREDLERRINGLPIVGEIPRVSKVEQERIVGGDLSTLSESFRIMRTNISFILNKVNKKDQGSVILVTSSIKGEGKTFVAINYAHILSQLKNKKTIIVGADIRNPQLHRYNREGKKAIGLTEFLYDDSISIDEVINVSNEDNMTGIIYSGKIPPNPSELLMSDRFTYLITELRKVYDYVIIDSAPLILVSDTYHISEVSDLTLYVIRSEKTIKDLLKHPIKAVEDGKLKNIVFVINDISTAHSGYGYGYKYNYGYGYGYGVENRRKNIFKRIWGNLTSK